MHQKRIGQHTSSGHVSIVSSLTEPYLLFWRHRRLLLGAVGLTLRNRFAGSLLGLAWLVIGPTILLGLYAVLYTAVLRIKPDGLSVESYICYIFAGLVPFIAFSQAVTGGANSLVTDRALLLNRIFPAELIPAREVVAAGAVMSVGSGIILVLVVFFQGWTIVWLLLPIIMVLLGMATMGLVWILALANLVAKDVQQLVGYIVIVLLIASPIAYTPEMVPRALQFLLYANPLAYFVQSFQTILVLGRVPSAGLLIGCVAFALVGFHGMYRVFSVGKRIIADHV